MAITLVFILILFTYFLFRLTKKDKKGLPIFYGFLLATFVTIITYIFKISFIENIIITIIFFLIKHIYLFYIFGMISMILIFISKNKKNINKNSKNSLNIIMYMVSFLGFLFVEIGLFLFFSIFFTNILLIKPIESNLSLNIKDYLIKKYGDCDFKLSYISPEYNYNGIIQEYLVGYDVTVKSDFTNDVFTVSLSTDFEPCSDDFLLSYYDDYFDFNRINMEVKKKLDEMNTKIDNHAKIDKHGYYQSVDFKMLLNNYNIIPEDYGKIPNETELEDFLINVILQKKLYLDVDIDAIDYKAHSMDEVKKSLNELNQNYVNKKTYTISGLTIYREKSLDEEYASKEELYENVYLDLSNSNTYLPVIEKRLKNYYKKVASEIVNAYPDIKYLKLQTRYEQYDGQLLIKNGYVYIDPSYNPACDIDKAKNVDLLKIKISDLKK